MKKTATQRIFLISLSAMLAVLLTVCLLDPIGWFTALETRLEYGQGPLDETIRSSQFVFVGTKMREDTYSTVIGNADVEVYRVDRMLRAAVDFPDPSISLVRYPSPLIPSERRPSHVPSLIYSADFMIDHPGYGDTDIGQPYLVFATGLNGNPVDPQVLRENLVIPLTDDGRADPDWINRFAERLPFLSDRAVQIDPVSVVLESEGLGLAPSYPYYRRIPDALSGQTRMDAADRIVRVKFTMVDHRRSRFDCHVRILGKPYKSTTGLPIPDIVPIRLNPDPEETYLLFLVEDGNFLYVMDSDPVAGFSHSTAVIPESNQEEWKSAMELLETLK